MIRMYLTGLGQGDDTNFIYSDSLSQLCWVVYLMGTFTLQIIFFNVLIAIMAKTHDEVSEKESENTNKGKVIMMEKFLWLIDIEQEFKGFTYVYYAKELDSEAKDDDVMNLKIQIATESKLIKKNQQNQQHTIAKMEKNMELMMEQMNQIQE